MNLHVRRVRVREHARMRPHHGQAGVLGSTFTHTHARARAHTHTHTQMAGSGDDDARELHVHRILELLSHCDAHRAPWAFVVLCVCVRHLRRYQNRLGATAASRHVINTRPRMPLRTPCTCVECVLYACTAPAKTLFREKDSERESARARERELY
jgi:hypothetical protein